jgi:phosphoglycerol transferase MdoB-like AlkP superfamily enzyme
MEPNYANLDPEESLNKLLAFVSVAFGLFSLCAGLIPIIGIITSILGIVAGIFGRRSESRKLASFGVALCALTLLLAFVYAFFVAVKP